MSGTIRRLRLRQTDGLLEGLLQAFGPHGIGARAELLARGAEVAVEQRAPETDPDPGANSRPVGLDTGSQPQRRFRLAEPGQGHGGALKLEADLNVIAEDQREA